MLARESSQHKQSSHPKASSNRQDQHIISYFLYNIAETEDQIDLFQAKVKNFVKSRSSQFTTEVLRKSSLFEEIITLLE